MSIFDELNRQQTQLTELLADCQGQLQRDQKELAFVTFQLISNKLVACMRAEHATVYPRFEREAKLVSEIAQARQQHDAIETVITRLRVGNLSRLAWRVELAKLAELVEQHQELEEYILFPMAALTFSTEQLARIGADFLAHLAMATTVADAAITYESATFEPPPTPIVRFEAA
ncbi:MAG TPA: hemerythrin domain-containing protein [Kofleriaceae bacterium]|jgi:iron-sulfur cluster repair protein YtfE (RIC family)